MATITPTTGTMPTISAAAIRRWEWLLGFLFLTCFWVVGITAGAKGIFVVCGLVAMAIAFFFPKSGLLGLTVIMAANVTFNNIQLVALIPATRAGDPAEEIGWQFFYDSLGAMAALAVMAALWAGECFRQLLAGQRWQLTRLEEALVWLFGLATVWLGLSMINGYEINPIAFDYSIFAYYLTAVLLGRTLKQSNGWYLFFSWLIAGVCLHWLILLADLIWILKGSQIFNPLYIMDVIRLTIGGSPDVSAPFVPVLLALIVCVRKKELWKYAFGVGLVFIFTFHVFASLYRSGVAQYVLSILILGYLLNRPGERRLLGLVILQALGVLVVGLGILAIVQPAVLKYGQMAVMSRIEETGKSSTSAANTPYDVPGSGGGEVLSNRHRRLETESALDDLELSDWMMGRGPGAHLVKRFWPNDDGREEPYLHNGYLWYILKCGVPGLLVLFWTYWRFFRVASAVHRKRELEPWMRAFTLGFVSAVPPMMIFAWTNNILGQPGGLYFLMPAFGWMCYAERYVRSSTDS